MHKMTEENKDKPLTDQEAAKALGVTEEELESAKRDIFNLLWSKDPLGMLFNDLKGEDESNDWIK